MQEVYVEKECEAAEHYIRIYAGEALYDPDVDPIHISLSPNAYSGLESLETNSWGMLIGIIEAEQ